MNNAPLVMISLLILALIINIRAEIDNFGSFSLQRSNKLKNTKIATTFSDNLDPTSTEGEETVDYQSMIEVSMVPYIPRSLMYYIQELGHLRYESVYEPGMFIPFLKMSLFFYSFLLVLLVLFILVCFGSFPDFLRPKRIQIGVTRVD
jgi:hypothetical protein